MALNSGFTLAVELGDDAAYLNSRINWGNEPPVNLILIKNAISGILAGTFQAGIASFNIGSALATATVTIGAGDFANNDTITINGIAFTAKTSGATGNQFNIGASLTETAENLVAAITNSTTKLIKQTVKAENTGAVITLTSRLAGVIGNTTATGGLFTLAKSAANVTLTATWAGGTDLTTEYFPV